MQCPPGKVTRADSAGLCYDACPSGYRDPTAGLCAQVCPPGSHDFGGGCTRESYTRGAGVLPFQVYLKKRKVPYGKK